MGRDCFPHISVYLHLSLCYTARDPLSCSSEPLPSRGPPTTSMLFHHQSLHFVQMRVLYCLFSLICPPLCSWLCPLVIILPMASVHEISFLRLLPFSLWYLWCWRRQAFTLSPHFLWRSVFLHLSLPSFPSPDQEAWGYCWPHHSHCPYVCPFSHTPEIPLCIRLSQLTLAQFSSEPNLKTNKQTNQNQNQKTPHATESNVNMRR